MDAEFWQERWRAGQIGFHEGRPNSFLERYAARLGSGRRVLVPLCGKSVDLAYLAGLGHDVVGVELVEDAVAAFFAEHGLTPTVARDEAFVRYQAGGITILAGDVFATSAGVLGPIDALYDRAALVALPADLRARYALHLRGLLTAGTPGLLVTLEYPQEAMAGPPFSVGEDEVRGLFAGAEVTPLDDGPLESPRLRATGASGRERCYLLRM
jgi:thiopurine S-methyltransferase